MRFFGGSRNQNSGNNGGDREYTFDTGCGETLRANSPSSLGGKVAAHQESCNTCKPGDDEVEFLNQLFDQ